MLGGPVPDIFAQVVSGIQFGLGIAQVLYVPVVGYLGDNGRARNGEIGVVAFDDTVVGRELGRGGWGRGQMWMMWMVWMVWMVWMM